MQTSSTTDDTKGSIIRSNFQPYFSVVSGLVAERLDHELFRLIKDHREFVDGFESILKDYYGKVSRAQKNSTGRLKPIELVSFHQEMKKGVFDLVEVRKKKSQPIDFDTEFEAFSQEMDEFLYTLDPKVTKVQDWQRFEAASRDSFVLRSGKAIKTGLYQVTTVPRRVSNLVASEQRKRPLNRWHQTVPMQHLATYYLKYGLASSFLPMLREVHRTISKTSLTVWRIDNGLEKCFLDSLNLPTLEVEPNERILAEPDPFEQEESNGEGLMEDPGQVCQNNEGINVSLPDEYREMLTSIEDSLRHLMENLKQESRERVQAAFAMMSDAYDKVDTIELSQSKFSESVLESRRKSLNSDFLKLNTGWVNNHFALFEEWGLDQELSIMRNLLLRETLHFDHHFCKKVETEIKPTLREIDSFIAGLSGVIEKAPEDSSEFRGLIMQEIGRIHDELTAKHIVDANEALSDRGVPALVDKVELHLRESVNNLSRKRAIVRTDTFDEELKASEINYVSPHDLVSFEAMPSFERKMKKLKSNIFNSVQAIQQSVLEIDQVADFSLDSALAMLDEEGKTVVESKAIALEGLQRVRLRIQKLMDDAESMSTSVVTDMQKAAKELNEGIMYLTQIDNIYEVRLKLTKAKALKNTRRYGAWTLNSIKDLTPRFRKKILSLVGEGTKFYDALRLRLGLAPASGAITAEVSTFLAETESAVARLPYVYQRLYVNEQLTDFSYFAGRNVEFKLMEECFSHWETGHFSPVALTAEKGGGVTSFINYYFNKSKESKYQLTRIHLSSIISDIDGFLSIFSQNTDGADVADLDGLSAHLNGQLRKQVIVLEDVQHLFLRKVGGFDLIKLLFELMAQTYKQVFWVVTSTRYSWEYLDKCINISEYFSRIIPMSDFTDKEVSELVMKRHRISGFNIRFLPSRHERVSNRFRKMSEEEQQTFLRRDYFSYLNRFAASNISIALLFWIRSTQEVKDNTISIKSLKDLDFGFLKELANSKQIQLYNLLIHDGLDLSQHAAIFNQSVTKSELQLLLLLDTGMVIRSGEGIFYINPLLYRQLVTLFKTRNLLH